LLHTGEYVSCHRIISIIMPRNDCSAMSTGGQSTAGLSPVVCDGCAEFGFLNSPEGGSVFVGS
jgi:hypothetical protein